MDENLDLDLGFEEQLLEAPEEPAEPLVRSFATVGAVYEDGVSLIFDGEAEATAKHYLCNANVYFEAGDRVRIIEDSGTYVVEYVVGPPRQQKLVGIPAGGSSSQVLTKSSATDYDAGWKAVPSEIPASGTNGQVLTKTANGPAWQDAPTEIPTSGTTGYVLTKTATGFAWQAVPTEIPTSGTTGYVLTKTSNGFGWAAAPTEIPASGTTGYVLTKTSSGFAWEAVPTEIPASGTTGYVLTKTSNGFGWAAVPTEIPASGTTGYVLTKTSSGWSWQVVSVPSPLWIPNPAYSANPQSSSYVIQFRTVGTYGDGAKQLQFRMGTSGTWYTLANA